MCRVNDGLFAKAEPNRAEGGRDGASEGGREGASEGGREGVRPWVRGLVSRLVASVMRARPLA